MLSASFAAWVAVLSSVAPVHGVDLTIQSLTVSQAVQLGSTRLIGGKVACVRATIGVAGASAPVAAVDAVLRVTVNGVPQSALPMCSSNGPITAPLSPQMGDLNHTVNFLVLVPASNDVDFSVEVNPTHQVAETNYVNNSLQLNNQVFECRATVELVYVPINYTPLGGPPSEALLEPGIGDGFVRAIYSPGEWNYHRSPLPPLTWTQSIGSSSSALLTTLRDLRINQIPAAGYAEAPFLFGWLPGNPYSGNGKAIGIPGDVAFGNTEIGRHQRTFAHELGHLIGLQHNSAFINTNGMDVEHHLWDTQDLPQLFSPDKRDIMVAGLLTHEAFINTTSYNKFLDDSRTHCAVPAAAGAPAAPVLRLAGVVSTTAPKRVVDFLPVTRVDRATLTHNDDAGDLLVVARDAQGAELWRVAVRTDTSTDLCAPNAPGEPALDPQAPFHLLIPESVNARTVHQVELIDPATGRMLSQRQRSASAPMVAVTAVGPAGTADQPRPPALALPQDQPLVGPVRIDWTASDPDGDPLTSTVLYSPDGGDGWLPLVVNTAETSFEFDTADVPASIGAQAIIRVTTSDGMNHGEAATVAMALGAGSPPFVYLLTPNDGDLVLQHAPVAFHAAAWDLEDRMLDGANIQWTSSINGTIGAGRQFLKSTLSPGTHAITVTGTDFSGMSSSKQITLVVTPRQVFSPDLNGDGVVNGQDIAMLLSAWGPCPIGAGICPADLNLSGQVNGQDLAILLGAWG